MPTIKATTCHTVSNRAIYVVALLMNTYAKDTHHGIVDYGGDLLALKVNWSIDGIADLIQDLIHSGTVVRRGGERVYIRACGYLLGGGDSVESGQSGQMASRWR